MKMIMILIMRFEILLRIVMHIAQYKTVYTLIQATKKPSIVWFCWVMQKWCVSWLVPTTSTKIPKVEIYYNRDWLLQSLSIIKARLLSMVRYFTLFGNPNAWKKHRLNIFLDVKVTKRLVPKSNLWAAKSDEYGTNFRDQNVTKKWSKGV